MTKNPVRSAILAQPDRPLGRVYALVPSQYEGVQREAFERGQHQEQEQARRDCDETVMQAICFLVALDGV